MITPIDGAEDDDSAAKHHLGAPLLPVVSGSGISAARALKHDPDLFSTIQILAETMPRLTSCLTTTDSSDLKSALEETKRMLNLVTSLVEHPVE